MARTIVNTQNLLAPENWTPEPNTGCWLWLGSLSNNYPVIETRRGPRSVHREIAGAVAGQVAMHSCDNPPCVNPAHLKAATQADNIADRHRKGRDGHSMGRAGEKNANARLVAHQVGEIRRRAAAGESQRAMAKEFGLHANYVGLIVSRRRWKSVD